MSTEARGHIDYFQEAVKQALYSMCSRGRGGAVVVLNGEIIGRGYNASPGDDPANSMCHTDYRTSVKPKSDRTCCVHAEWRAIINAIRNKKDINGSMIYYASVDEEGNMRRSGQPYCTVCSRLALDTGIKYFLLWQDIGIKLFNTKEYNKISYDFHRFQPAV